MVLHTGTIGPTAHWFYGPIMLRISTVGPAYRWPYDPLVLHIGNRMLYDHLLVTVTCRSDRFFTDPLGAKKYLHSVCVSRKSIDNTNISTSLPLISFVNGIITTCLRSRVFNFGNFWLLVYSVWLKKHVGLIIYSHTNTTSSKYQHNRVPTWQQAMFVVVCNGEANDTR